ncbi:MAG: Yip1 family protein, partial [Euryarchaeota archaeon]|nr:Yip1 family protein [Euryarchaeota archaeon]
MTNVLANPDRFISELSARDVNLKIPFLIVLVVAIIAAISAAMMFDAITSSLPAEAAAFAGIGAAAGAIGGLIMQFIMWLLYAGVFYVVSMLFGGEGSFKRVFEFVGYGFIP